MILFESSVVAFKAEVYVCVCAMHMCFFALQQLLHTVRKKKVRALSLSLALTLSLSQCLVYVVLALLVRRVCLIVRCAALPPTSAAASSMPLSALASASTFASFWRKQDNDPHRQTGAHTAR